MRDAFIVTSAINTRFGVYDAKQRLDQTIATIKSIVEFNADPYVVLVEMAATPLTPEQKVELESWTDIIVDFTKDPHVAAIASSPNWDHVKSLTEMTCFNATLDVLQKRGIPDDIRRIFKVSGRYTLNSKFSLNRYQLDHVKDKIVFAKLRQSQFDPKVTGGTPYQYMSRCWSFPVSEVDYIKSAFTGMTRAFVETARLGGYLDIEHLLYLYLDPVKIVEADVIGVEGHLGPNGNKVQD